MINNVAKGALLLDEKRPNWFKEIDSSKLNLTSSYDCVLGQLFGDFYDGLLALDVPYPTEWGFLCEASTTGDCTCSNLRVLWIDEINKRRDTE